MIAFSHLSWVQLNAFSMTLRKKQILTEHGLFGTYALLSLAVTSSCLYHTARPLASLVIGVAMLSLRARGVSKYWLWAGLGAALLVAPTAYLQIGK